MKIKEVQTIETREKLVSVQAELTFTDPRFAELAMNRLESAELEFTFDAETVLLNDVVQFRFGVSDVLTLIEDLEPSYVWVRVWDEDEDHTELWADDYCYRAGHRETFSSPMGRFDHTL